jgi:hypothetical protein
MLIAILAMSTIPLFEPATWEPGALAARLSAELARPEDAFAVAKWSYAAYKDPEAYRATIAALPRIPVEKYDPAGFLASIGVEAPVACSRTDESLLSAWRLTDYQPDPRYLPVPGAVAGPTQWVLLGGAKGSPWAIQGVVHGLTAMIITGMEAPDKKDPFPFGQDSDIATPSATTESISERYSGVLARRPSALGWGQGVHTGSITPEETGEAWGTFDIARALGFDDAQARRIAVENYAVDLNQTHYTGRITTAGSGGAKGDLHWHFNRADAGQEDTRIAAAKVHLDRAVRFAKDRFYDAAEREVGIGLHGLQDMFTHGQISPLTHALLAEFPDKLAYHPVAMFETALVTEGYLDAYLDKLGIPGSGSVSASASATASATASGTASGTDTARPPGLRGVPFMAVLQSSGIRVQFEPGSASRYDRIKRLATVGNQDALRHELVHALDHALEDDPEIGNLWVAYRTRLHREGRRAGAIAFEGPDAREYLAQQLD